MENIFLCYSLIGNEYKRIWMFLKNIFTKNVLNFTDYNQKCNFCIKDMIQMLHKDELSFKKEMELIRTDWNGTERTIAISEMLNFSVSIQTGSLNHFNFSRAQERK